MGRWNSLAALFLIGVGVIAAGHYYLWSRLIRNVGFSPATQRILTAILCLLAVSIPVAVVTSRLVPPDWSTWWVTPVYLWIGVAFLLLLSVAAVDVLSAGPFKPFAITSFVWSHVGTDANRTLNWTAENIP